ncbi:TPA: hypothetical protein ACGSTA_001661 [Enterobacter cloacae]
MSINIQAVLRTNSSSADTDWQEIQLGCPCGSEIDMILLNTSGVGSGTVLTGVRKLNNYGTADSVLNYRFVLIALGVNDCQANGNTGIGVFSTNIVTLPSWATPAQSVYTIAYSSGTTSNITRIEVTQSGDTVTSSDYVAGRTDINIPFNV